MNQQIFYFLNNFVFRYDWLDTLIYFCANWLPFWLVGIFIMYELFKLFNPRLKESLREKYLLKNFFRKIFIVFGATLLIWGVSQIINYFYYSPRPFLVLDDLNILFIHGDVDSFPSGHATFFFSLAFMSYYYNPIWLTVLLINGAILVSFARVMSGVHWPADILAAAILSLLGVLIIQKIINYIFSKKKYIN